jgi:hypothetical protein
MTTTRYYLATLLLAFYALVAAACAAGVNDVDQLFVEPEIFDGTKVEICGLLNFRFENHNLYPAKRYAASGRLGIGVAPGEVAHDDLLAYDNQRVCLSGTVRYSGCEPPRVYRRVNSLGQAAIA